MKLKRQHLSYAAYLAALMLCLAVFTLYMRPDFMVTLSNQIWACF